MGTTLIFFLIVTVHCPSVQNYLMSFFQRKFKILWPKALQRSDYPCQLDYLRDLGYNIIEEQKEVFELYAQRLEIYSFCFFAVLAIDLRAIHSYVV